MRVPLVSLLLALALPAGNAAPKVCDLGLGLTYHRLRHLPADLPKPDAAPRQPLVLDLRYVHGGTADAATLDA
jgi:hypothetical protein